MKLSQIRESLANQALNVKAGRTGIATDTQQVANSQEIPPQGLDAGSRASGNTNLPTGIPTKPRHRKFLGVSQGMG